MKRYGSVFLAAVLFFAVSAATVYGLVREAEALAEAKNAADVKKIGERIHEVIGVLETLAQSGTIQSGSIGFGEKARFLTDVNREMGYLMICILDKEINVYSAGVEKPVSSFASRGYLQRLYASGKTEVTDAFLAGADGKTLVYTIAVPVMTDGKVAGALFAAIRESEINAFLQEDRTAGDSVLIGRKMQAMSGVPFGEFGMPLYIMLEKNGWIWRPAEEITGDFQARNPGAFWGVGDFQVNRFIYAPVRETGWVVMSRVGLLHWTPYLVLYLVFLGLLAGAGVFLYCRGSGKKRDENPG